MANSMREIFFLTAIGLKGDWAELLFKFRRYFFGHLLVYLLKSVLLLRSVGTKTDLGFFGQYARSNITSHNNYCIAKVHLLSFGVGKHPVF